MRILFYPHSKRFYLYYDIFRLINSKIEVELLDFAIVKEIYKAFLKYHLKLFMVLIPHNLYFVYNTIVYQ